MAMNSKTWKKQTDSQKSSIFQDWQEEMEIMNNPITSTEIKTMIKKKISQRTKAQDQMASQENSVEHLEKR